MEINNDLIVVDKFVLIIDNRNERRILRISDENRFRWRKMSINIKQLLNYQYYQKLEVNNGTLKPVPEIYSEEQGEQSQEQLNDNRQIFSSLETQKLQPEDIQQLKKQFKGQELIQQITQNNQQFQKRSQYSKEKYLKRKQKKYLFTIHVEPTCLENIHKHFYLSSPKCVVNIRWDMLAFALLEAGPFDRALIIEQGKGIMSGSALVRGADSVHVIGKHLSIPPLLNLSPHKLQSLKHIDWQKLNTFGESSFTNLIIAGNYDFKQILQKIIPFLKNGSPLVCFCVYLQPLTECYQLLKELQCIRIKIYDGWSRQYQVLKNRTHPLMRMHSCSGFLLTAIKT